MEFRIGSLKVDISLEKVMSDNFEMSQHIYYHKNSKSELNALCDRYGSDKGEIASTGHPYPWPSHTYADFYEARFAHCRDHIRSVFECGLGTNNANYSANMGSAGKPGASLRIWREFFPNAEIFGGDIDREILFSEERIQTYFVDQTNPEVISQLWEKVPVAELDIMIDDGLHTFEAGVCLYENSIQKLKPLGTYIIEDVNNMSMLRFAEYFNTCPHKVEFVDLRRKGVAVADNALVVITKS